MRHDNHSVFKINQEFLEPADRLKIKMVRRLVEQQDIRVSKKRLGKQHLYFLAAVQLRHLFLMQIIFNAKPV